MHVAAQGNLVAVQTLDLADIHARHRIKRVQRMGACLHQGVDDGHNIAVGVLDDVKSVLSARFADFCKERRDVFIKHCGREKGTRIIAIVGAKQRDVNAPLSLALIFLDGALRLFLCLL